MGKFEDGMEKINYPMHTECGPISFSLIDFETIQDLAQDDLQDLVLTHWLVYKQDL